MAYEAAARNPPTKEAIHALASRAIDQVNMGRTTAATHDAHQAVALARRSGYRVGETHALTALGVVAYYGKNSLDALAWLRQAQARLSADIPGYIARLFHVVLAVVLADVGDLDAARHVCIDGLARCREADDLGNLAGLLMVRARIAGLAGDPAEMRAHLHEAVEVASRIGDRINVRNCIEECGKLCAMTGRWAEAVTLWAAHAGDAERTGIPGNSSEDSEIREYRLLIEQALEPAEVRGAEDRGTKMTLAAAAELVTMLTAPQETEPTALGGGLTERERELVTLVAQGHTNAEIAARLFISGRTVSSHLDRIRDKTGRRRRADLTRLALQEGLV
jgi:DNA-binding CsgD family transcriptional regulator